MILPVTPRECCIPQILERTPSPLPNCIFYGKISTETVQHFTCILTILTLHPRQTENPGGIPGKNTFLLLLFDQGMSVVILANFVDNETAFKTKLKKNAIVTGVSPGFSHSQEINSEKVPSHIATGSLPSLPTFLFSFLSPPEQDV